MKLFQFLEQIVGSIVVIVMITIASFTVLSLNPTESKAEGGSVAGIVTESTSESDSIIGVIANFPKDIIVESFDNTYTLRFDSVTEMQIISAFKLTNFSENSGQVRVELLHEQALEGSLRVELADSIDRIVLASPMLGNQQRTITVDSESSRTFNLEISSEEQINFPVELVISII